VAVCRWLTTEIGVAAIPPSPFYSAPHQPLTDNLARFTFCKSDDLLDEAARRLQRIRSLRTRTSADLLPTGSGVTHED
jgi:aspartate/methionine/tyrosine aminotransferase